MDIEEIKKEIKTELMDSYIVGNLAMLKMIRSFISKTPNCTTENILTACDIFGKLLNEKKTRKEDITI